MQSIPSQRPGLEGIPGPVQSSIVWPTNFLPGTTDNFVSNEVIAKDVTAAQVWELLVHASKWESYYKNCSDVTPPASRSASTESDSEPVPLRKGDTFQFATFGFPKMTPTVKESVAPASKWRGGAGRLAWLVDEGGIQVYHAWLVEDLEGGRVRVLTQESQIGEVFVALREDRPNKMLLGHQDWLDGLVRAAREDVGEKVADRPTNLGSIGAWERS